MVTVTVTVPFFRSDREKSILQGKLRVAQRNIIESSGRPQSDSGRGKEATPTAMTEESTLSSEERHKLKSKIYQLENEVCVHVYSSNTCKVSYRSRTVDYAVYMYMYMCIYGKPRLLDTVNYPDYRCILIFYLVLTLYLYELPSPCVYTCTGSKA